MLQQLFIFVLGWNIPQNTNAWGHFSKITSAQGHDSRVVRWYNCKKATKKDADLPLTLYDSSLKILKTFFTFFFQGQWTLQQQVTTVLTWITAFLWPTWLNAKRLALFLMSWDLFLLWVHAHHVSGRTAFPSDRWSASHPRSYWLPHVKDVIDV